MTAPGGGGPTGMSYGDDYVAARLSIEIPDEGIAGIRELTAEVERFRTAMEAATRGEADMQRYLDQMAEASERAAKAQSLLVQQLTSLSGSAGGMSPPTGGGGLLGPTGQPILSGLGTGAAINVPSSRPVNVSDVPYQLAQHPVTNPREYLNMQDARGGLPEGTTVGLTPQTIRSLADNIARREKDVAKEGREEESQLPTPSKPGRRQTGEADPYDALQRRIASMGGLSSKVMNEMGLGASGVGLGSLALQGVNWARKRFAEAPGGKSEGKKGEGEEGGGEEEGGDTNIFAALLGGKGGIGKLLGGIGTAITAALAGYGLVKKGGQEVQQWRNLGSITGGMAGEGAEADWTARWRAMRTPWLSNQQSREIQQALMSEGYTKEGTAKEATDFMQTWVKQTGMPLSAGLEELRLAAKGTKISFQDLQDTMTTVQKAAQSGFQSQQDIWRELLERQGQLVAQGVEPNAARRAALVSTQMYPNNALLAGQGLTTGDLSQGGMMMAAMYGGANMPTGLMPTEYGRYLTETGQAETAIQGSLQMWANTAKRMFHDVGDDEPGSPGYPAWLNATGFFNRMVQKMAPGKYTEQQAIELYRQLTGGGEGNPVAEAKERANVQDNEAGNASQSRETAGGRTTPAPTAAPKPKTPAAPRASRDQEEEGGERETQKQRPTPTPQPTTATQSSSRVTVSGQIDLTEQAKQLLKFLGPTPSRLTVTQRGANQGAASYQVNQPAPGEK